MLIKDNKIENLRVVERTKSQVEKLISNLSILGNFTDEDKEITEEYKKIYELGLDQLKVFIDKLEELGPKLDEYTILYFTEQLLNGPLVLKVIEYTNNLSKPYWKKSPDIMGVTGNTGTDNSSVPVFATGKYALNINTDVYNKLPKFMQNNLKGLTRVTQDIFTDNMNTATITDNTLPIVDKKPFLRISNESQTDHNYNPHGNYLVKDVGFDLTIKQISKQIFELVKEFLGGETFRLYDFKKQINAYDSEKNPNTTGKVLLERILTCDDTQRVTIKTDVLGNTYDSEERRKAELKIPSKDKDKKFKLHTVKGQLGSGEEVKKEPIDS